jgi:hypothetical protein
VQTGCCDVNQQLSLPWNRIFKRGIARGSVKGLHDDCVHWRVLIKETFL